MSLSSSTCDMRLKGNISNGLGQYKSRRANGPKTSEVMQLQACSCYNIAAGCEPQSCKFNLELREELGSHGSLANGLDLKLWSARTAALHRGVLKFLNLDT